MDPDSTWWIGDNEVCWEAPTPPPGVRISGYQLVRGVEVTPADGGPPELQWVPWGPVMMDIGGELDGGCLQVDTFEIDVTEYIVDVLHWHHTPTAIRRRTWGEVKRTVQTLLGRKPLNRRGPLEGRVPTSYLVDASRSGFGSA